MQIKFLLFLFIIFGVCYCKIPQVLVHYRSGQTETVKKAEFHDLSGNPLFRLKGRQVIINQKKLHYMNVFADTIEIYYGDTWCRVDIYPILSKKDTNTVVHNGWMKISTILKGQADFGKLSASISELSYLHFRPKELIVKEDKKQTPQEESQKEVQEEEIPQEVQPQEQEPLQEPTSDDEFTDGGD